MFLMYERLEFINKEINVSPLVLNRFVRVGGFFVGIFVLFLGLNSCSTVNTQDNVPVEQVKITPPEITPPEITPPELAENWWAKVHSDTFLLNRDVFLEQCFEEDTTPSDLQAPYRVGAFIHPRSIREKSWDDKPFKFMVGASIVPYIEGKNWKHLIMPKDDEKFDSYLVRCGVTIEPRQSYVGQSDVEIRPHYYPSMLFKNPAHTNRIFEELKQWDWIELTTTPVEIKKFPLKMRDLLQKILSYKEGAKSRVTAWTNQLNLPADTRVEFNQLKPKAGFKLNYTIEGNEQSSKQYVQPTPSVDTTTPTIQLSSSNVQPTPSVDTTTPTIQSSSSNVQPTPSVDTTQPIRLPTSHEVKIKLPNDFVKKLGGAKVLIGKMKLVGCENATITYSNNTFFADCPSKLTTLNINGFKPIKPYDAKSFYPSQQDIYSEEISLYKNNSVVKDLKVDSKVCQTLGDRLSFHYTCIGQELSFKRRSERCGYIGTISLPALEDGKLKIESTGGCSVYLVSPFKLSTAPATGGDAGECELLKKHKIGKKDLTSQVLECDGTYYKFELKWKGWEPIEVTVDRKSDTTHIQPSKFKPIWPFTNGNWTSSSEHATGTPLCDVEPTYVGYTNKKWGDISPNTTISVKVKQQSQDGKIARGYKKTATISWKPYDVVRGGEWDLLSKYALDLKNISTMTFTAEPSLPGMIFQYKSMKACRENKGALRLGTYFVKKRSLRNVSPCASFRLKDDDESDEFVSHCAQADGNNSVFFQPVSCGNLRKLVVISTGKALDEHKYGGGILKKSLIKVFQQTAGRKIPFTVVTIDKGRTVSEPLLSCEDVDDVTTTSSKQFVLNKLRGLSFDATDLQTLRDLELVHNAYGPEKLDSVFYLVTEVPDNIDPIKDFAIPYGWRRQDIHLTVLTTTEKSCKVWSSNRVKCYSLSRQNEKALKDFLSIQ